MRKLTMFFALALLSAGQFLHADVNYKGRTEIGLRGGAIFTEGNSNIDEEGIYGGQIGYNVTQHVGVEAGLLATQTELRIISANGGNAINTNNRPSGVVVAIPSLEVLYHFTQNRFRPFVAAGLADIFQNAGTNAGMHGQTSAKQDDLGVQYGAGFKWLFTNHLLFRTDARHLINLEKGYAPAGTSKNNALVTVGLSWLFGQSDESEPAKVAEAPKPEPTPVAAAPVAPVVPAPVDTDGDGVIDEKDECPGTPAGTTVDATGCAPTVKAIEDNWTIQGVQFESGSDKIKPESHATLDDAAAILAARSRVRVEIQGHTDNTGKAESNLSLSERRAASIKSYLVGKGVSASQLETKGFGDTQPVADNTTREGRAKNRRIDFKVLSR